jgi:geranylgeranyl pyrophosphate synthase
VPVLAEQLKAEGALDYTQTVVEELTVQALHALEHARPQGEAGQALHELAEKLLTRRY